jgi:deoxyadenosine/deoxycytidine kinase
MKISSGLGPLVRSDRIEICGGIASGKTTLANLTRGLAVSVVLEDFHANPFWRTFYNDPTGTAFETEITFLLQHYHAVKVANALGGLFACDFSFYLDSAYADVTLRGTKRDAFRAILDEVRSEVAVPTLLIYLRCDPHVELERIVRRGRDAEKSITLGYLHAIGSTLEDVVEKRQIIDGVRVVVVDSQLRNFADDEDDQNAVLDEISIALGLALNRRCEERAEWSTVPD